jgi:hypothetical protein
MTTTRLNVSKEVHSGSEHLALALVGRRSFPLGYIDLETGQLIPQPGLDADYLDAVLKAAGTSQTKLLSQHLNPRLHEPFLNHVFPSFPRTQVRAIGGRLVPAGYRVFFTARNEHGRGVGYYALFIASPTGQFPRDSEPSARVEFGAGTVIAMAEYLALTEALAELVSKVRKWEAQPHAVAGDIWSDSMALVEQVNGAVPPGDGELREQYNLAFSYLKLLGTWRLRYHPPVYSLLSFGIA